MISCDTWDLVMTCWRCERCNYSRKIICGHDNTMGTMRGLTKVIEWSDENVPTITDEKVLTQMMIKYPNLDP